MTTKKSIFDYYMENLSKAGDVSAKPMMGEYLIYFNGKLIGGIYDGDFLVKKTPSSTALLGGGEERFPYNGSKSLMYFVSDVENTEFITALLKGLYSDL